MLPGLPLIFLCFLGVSFCSAQVPKVPSWQLPSFQSANMSDHVVPSQITQSEVIQQEGHLLQESLPETKHSWQQIQSVSEASQLCEVDEFSRVGCGEPGISSAECEALECCYDNRRFIRAYDGPMCFYRKAGKKCKLKCFLVLIILNQCGCVLVVGSSHLFGSKFSLICNSCH